MPGMKITLIFHLISRLEGSGNSLGERLSVMVLYGLLLCVLCAGL